MLFQTLLSNQLILHNQLLAHIGGIQQTICCTSGMVYNMFSFNHNLHTQPIQHSCKQRVDFGGMVLTDLRGVEVHGVKQQRSVKQQIHLAHLRQLIVRIGMTQQTQLYTHGMEHPGFKPMH
jgi:hypothetical protein